MAQCVHMIAVQVWWPEVGPQNSQENSMSRHASIIKHSYGKIGDSDRRIIQKVVGQLVWSILTGRNKRDPALKEAQGESQLSRAIL